jgi:peptide-methionine (S)-S-oxide reductase
VRSRILSGLVAAIGMSSLALAGPASTRATAIFAGGCFWSEEKAFEGVSGVVSVTSGYAGGQTKDPTYEQVSSGSTGYAESVEVVYDPAKVTYEHLLEVYWHNSDPLEGAGQFCDFGTQYRPVIFYADEAQRTAAEESKRKLEELPQFKGKIATQIQPASKFYPAEAYHQDFYKKNPARYGQYRQGCGRDARLQQIWGDAAGGH